MPYIRVSFQVFFEFNFYLDALKGNKYLEEVLLLRIHVIFLITCVFFFSIFFYLFHLKLSSLCFMGCHIIETNFFNLLTIL